MPEDILLPFVVLADRKNEYSVLDLRKRKYAARRIRSLAHARRAADALNDCFCERDEFGMLTAIDGKPLIPLVTRRRSV